MTRAEEVADQYGITEAHDENCQGDGLCRQHFIEKLEEAYKKRDSGEYPSIKLIALTFGASPTPQSVEVWTTCREEGKPEPIEVLLFERHKPRPPRADDAMVKALKREFWAKRGIRMA